ncbi:hypothetical protein L1785_13405 [Antribacter sp. KLBMP9083]|uniref:Secreted protein n=1 Tax=Antribacter soli TaxID=2910976 RepID=A0AA41QEH0_9MICO|nr:hypothetical protein [Antribacter soli]MCF4121975.1 hypothetical protein [Antribacter soli]
MRKMSVLLATLGLLVAGTLFPVTSAQAASQLCDSAWQSASSGSFYAYDYADCLGRLGSSAGNDSHWGDAAGGFQGTDTNRASSILHKGTSGLAVKVYNGNFYTGAYACIKRSEYYVSSLDDDYLTGGVHFTDRVPASNTISSHKWVEEAACGGVFLH